MIWHILFNFFITLHLSKGLEERIVTNLQQQSFKCFSGNCGGDSSSSTKVLSVDFTFIKCFKCDNCHHVGNHTIKVECPSSNCCYTAHVKNQADGLLYVIRDCGRWDHVNGCTMTCTDAQNHHLQMNPFGVFIKCITCNEGDTDECNGEDYGALISAINPPQPVMCYQCRKCNQINSNTFKVKCPFPQCCYTVLVRDQPNEDMFSARGCILSNEPCFNTCNQKRRQHILTHANGTFEYCMTCSVGDSDECNRNTYSRPTTLRNAVNPTVVLCYECHDCNKVDSTTPTVVCPNAKCCYVALLNEYPEGHVFVVRGCIKRNENCSDTCKSVEYTHIQAHYEGTISFCMVCGDSEGNLCNLNTYKPRIMTKNPLNETIDETNCFSCKNCDDVTIDTDKIICVSNCCYMKIVQGISERGCVRYLSGGCDEYCVNQTYHFCDSCSSNNCNIRRIRSDTRDVYTIFKRTSYINCYECVDCYSISETVNQTVACPGGCCVIAWWTTHKDTTMLRMCVHLNGKRCQDYCEHAREVLISQDPKAVMHYCEDCMIDKCNYIEVYQAQISTQKHPHINCYLCDNCTRTSAITETVLCLSDCCYSAILQINGKSGLARACAKIRPNLRCLSYCQYVETDLKKGNSAIAVEKCVSCQTDKCNTDTLSIIKQSHIHETVYSNSEMLVKHGMRKSNAKLELGIQNTSIHCYKCENCEHINPKKTESVLCSDRCCYATKLKNEKGKVITERDCLKIEPGRTCMQFCIEARKEHTVAQPSNSVNFTCNVCESEKCNTVAFDDSQISTPTPTYNPISCYNCIGCYNLDKKTETIVCPDNCCYTARWTENGHLMMARLCALLNGRQCGSFCSYLTKRLKSNRPIGILQNCSTCCSQKCNSENFPEPEADNTTRHHNCYECKSCEEVSSETRNVSCLSDCCYSELKRQDDGTRVTVRNCAKLFPGTSCLNFCSNLKKLHRQSNPHGTVIYCKTCITEKCNSEKLDTDEIGVPNKAPINCFDCDDCYSVTNQTNRKLCNTACCITVVWAHLSNTYIRRDCLKPIETPCSKYCENAKRLATFSDSSSRRYFDCDVCKNNDCNRLIAMNPQPITPPPFSCYGCSGCDELTLRDTKVRCFTYCCFIWLKQFGQPERYKSERGCCSLSPGTNSQNMCGQIQKASSETSQKIQNCSVCTADLCNHANVKNMVDAANKPIKTTTKKLDTTGPTDN